MAIFLNSSNTIIWKSSCYFPWQLTWLEKKNYAKIPVIIHEIYIYFTIEAIRCNVHFFFSLLFELIGQCLMFTAFDFELQMNASACARTHIRTLFNFYTLKTFPHSSVSGVDDVCIRNCVGFSLQFFFSSLVPFRHFVLHFRRSTETDKREMSVSWSILLGKCFQIEERREKKVRVRVHEYVSIWISVSP